MNAIRTVVVCLVGAVIGLAAVSAPAAYASTELEDCRTVTSTLTDRPDSAVGGGTWALDQLTRTATVCQIEPGLYSGEVTDVGTFITQELDHTPAGVTQPLPGGVEGTVEGGFTTVEFRASPDWGTFERGVLDGVTVTGADHPSGTWVSDLFTDVDDSTLDGENWSWTYETCAEQWINQASALGGNSGDITGEPACVEPVEPTVTDETCDASGTLTIPEVDGVSYLVEGGLVEPGTTDVVAGDYAVEAVPEEGFAFGEKYSWELTVSEPEGSCATSAPEPSAGDGEDSTPPPVEQLPDTGAISPWSAVGLAGLLMISGAVVILATRRSAQKRR